MLVRLHVIRGKANKESVTITLPAVIGRSRDADLTVIHPMISRRHCELFEEQGLVKIRDLGSLNGTYVAGEQVQEAYLPPGAVFSLGPLTFRVDYDTSPKAVSHEPSVLQPETAVAPPSDIVVAHDGPSPCEGPAPQGELPPAAHEPATEPQPLPEDSAPTGPFPAEVAPAQVPPRIAPPDGALPDFRLWQQPAGPQPEPPCAPQSPPPSSADPKPPTARSAPVSPSAGPDDRWAETPPAFTKVISRDSPEPLAPILLENGMQKAADHPVEAPAPQPTESAGLLGTARKSSRLRLGWWPFRR